jgi:hypothetical protein
MACALEILRRNRAPGTTIEQALDREYRYTSRAVAQGDFVEGIRAQIVDKDRAPRWTHDLDGVPEAAVAAMLAPVDRAAPALDFGEETA